jgi:hypothetical protein
MIDDGIGVSFRFSPRPVTFGGLLELIQDMPDVSARSDRDRDAPLSRRFIE